MSLCKLIMGENPLANSHSKIPSCVILLDVGLNKWPNVRDSRDENSVGNVGI